MFPILTREQQIALEVVGDVALGVDQKIAWQSDNAFVGSATSGARQFRHGNIRNVDADDGEIAAAEFPNIRATAATHGLRPVFMRIRADAFEEIDWHVLFVPIGTYQVKLHFVYSLWIVQRRPEIIGSSVVRLLREKRIALGLSMNAVATRAGLSHTMVSRVERELRKPTLDTLLRISGAMEIDLWPMLKKSENSAGPAKFAAKRKN